MKTLTNLRMQHAPMPGQRGLVLFFALIALVVMSLAAVALVRSVDTSTLIANNMSYKQSGTTAADAAGDIAMIWIDNTIKSTNLDFNNNPLHPLNNDIPAAGYYSNSLSKKDPLTNFQWDNTDSQDLGADGIGNNMRIIIQRMCTIANTTPVAPNTCLYIGNPLNLGPNGIPQLAFQCNPGPCPQSKPIPALRVTVQSKGPKNTLSYVQTFIH